MNILRNILLPLGLPLLLAMGILAGRYADNANYPSNSRARLRGGIYAERVTARGIMVGNKIVQLAKKRNISPASYCSRSSLLHRATRAWRAWLGAAKWGIAMLATALLVLAPGLATGPLLISFFLYAP